MANWNYKGKMRRYDDRSMTIRKITGKNKAPNQLEMALALGSNLRTSHTKVAEKQKTEKKGSAFITTLPLDKKSDNSKTSKKNWKDRKEQKKNSDKSSVSIS